MALTIVVGLVARWAATLGDTPVRDLTLYQVAMLAGGPGRVSDTALAYLTWAGMIEVRESTNRLVRLVGVDTVPDLQPMEVAILGAIHPAGIRPEAAMSSGRRMARSEVNGLDGLIVDHVRAAVATGLVLAGSGGVLVASAWWMATAPAGTRGFVPLIALIAVVFGGWWLAAGRPRLTRSGRRLLEGIRSRYDGDLQIAAIGVTSLPVERAMHVIALYGRDALTGGLSALRKVITGNPAPALVLRSSLSR